MGDKELHRLDAPEVALVGTAQDARLAVRALPGQPRDGVEGGPQKVDGGNTAARKLVFELLPENGVRDGVEHQDLLGGQGVLPLQYETPDLLDARHLGKPLYMDGAVVELGGRRKGHVGRRVAERVRNDVDGRNGRTALGVERFV